MNKGTKLLHTMIDTNAIRKSSDNVGRNDRARKHVIIGAKAGCKDCMHMNKEGYKMGYTTKDDYESLFRLSL